MMKRLNKFLSKWGDGNPERGSINIASILMMGIGMVFLAVGFIMFPIVTDACTDLLAWTYTDYTVVSITDATFTGFSQVVGITPLLVLLGFVAAGIFAMYLGVKIGKGAAGGTTVNLGSMLMLALAIVFIAVALIIMPVALDGICSSYVMEGTQVDTEAITTGVGQITANVTLPYELWNADITHVISVSSNVTETPTVTSYNATDNHLLLSTLTANVTHTITTTFNNAALIDGTAEFTGLAQILLISPLLLIVAFVSAAVVSGFFGVKKLSA